MNYVWWQVLLVVLVSYFCGNISFARTISNSQHEDITKFGSGNPGSTNTLRRYGFKFGLLNLILDMLKSYVPAMISYYLFGKSLPMLYISGLACVIGHNYPIVWKFKGGKGVASIMGIFLAANPLATLIVLVIGFIVWALFEYGSIVSLLCVTALTVIEGLHIKEILNVTDMHVVSLILFALFLLMWYAHRKNIERLLLGKESKASLIKKSKKTIKKQKELS